MAETKERVNSDHSECADDAADAVAPGNDCPWPSTLDQLYSVLASPHYIEKPFELLYFFYVIDTIGRLPEETQNVLMEFAMAYDFEAGWRAHVREELGLEKRVDASIRRKWRRWERTEQPQDGYIRFAEKLAKERVASRGGFDTPLAAA